MRRLTDAYTRALFPSRYRAPNEQHLGLASGPLELSLAAAVYRLVSGVEGLLDTLGERRQALPGRARGVRSRPATTPAGCG